MHPNVHCSTIHNNQDMVTIIRRMDKEDLVYIYTMEYNSDMKNRMK